MTALYPKHAFNVVPGEPQPTAAGMVTKFFRRALRLVRRKQAPEGVASGATTALIANRYPCCPCCVDGSPCEPRDSHLAPCDQGCNDVPGGIVQAEGVLDDRMIADVRKQWNAWHDSTPLPTALLARHADAMHEISKPYLPPPPRRPVNGRSLGTLPRKQTPDHPPWDTQAFPAVTDEVPDIATLVEQFGIEQERAEYVRSQMRGAVAVRDPETLRQVLAGLKKKLGTDREATYLGGWQ